MASARSQHPSKIVYSITCALPGQVGFCVPSIAEDPEYVQRLQALLFANRWVMSEQVDRAAASIAITYKSGVIPDNEMRSHFASLIQSASDPVVATDLTTVPTQLPTQDAASLGFHPQSASHVDETNQLATQTSRIDYSITHALLGEVGFCVPRIAEDPEYVQRLQALLEAERWVTTQSVNSAAASIAITYKPGVIPDGEMRAHFASLIQSASDAVVAPNPTATSTQLPTQDPARSHSHPQPVTHLDKTNQRATQHSTIDYSIAHAIPGRVRFHVPRIAKDPKYVQRLESLLEAEPWITSQRVNSAAASIAITYKSGVLPDAQTRWRSMGEAQSHLATLIQSASDAVVATGYEQ